MRPSSNHVYLCSRHCRNCGYSRSLEWLFSFDELVEKEEDWNLLASIEVRAYRLTLPFRVVGFLPFGPKVVSFEFQELPYYDASLRGHLDPFGAYAYCLLQHPHLRRFQLGDGESGECACSKLSSFCDLSSQVGKEDVLYSFVNRTLR